MKRLLLGLLFSNMALAGNSGVLVKNFNFTYSNPVGEGSAEVFNRDSLFQEGVYVRAEKVANDFHLHVTGSENHEFQLKNAPTFLTDAETMSITGFNLNYSQTVSASLREGRFNSKDDSLRINDFTLNCSRSVASELMDEVISGCLQKLSLKSSRFSSEAAEKILSTTAVAGAIGVNALDLKVNNGKFELAADLKADISGKVKGNGNLSYSAQTGLLTIKISEVKFGFLNITGKVFDELKKNENEKMKVKQPYVYLQLK